MAAFRSFENVLGDWLEQIQPRRILEWGPGYSTSLMQARCPEAEIVSIEHNVRYFHRAQRKFGAGVRLLRFDFDKKESEYATAALEQGVFDLIFIDGRRRVECCVVALQCLNPGGVVLLHDAEREKYRRPLQGLVEEIEYRDDTLVFRPKVTEEDATCAI